MASSKAKAAAPPEINFYGGVRRACDACRKKKIRCDAQQPCGTCRKNDLSCLYQFTPKKKTPRGPRPKPAAAAISTDHRSSLPTSPAVFVAQSHLPVLSSIKSHEQQQQHQQLHLQFQHSPTSSASLNQVLAPAANGSFTPIGYGVGGDQAFSLESHSHSASPASYASGYSNGHSESSLQHEFQQVTPHSELSLAFHQHINTPGGQLPSSIMQPFVELFFQKMFPIMPVLDRDIYLNPDLLRGHESLPSEEYTLLTALSAVTIVQLNLMPNFVQQSHPALTAELLVDECFRERTRSDYIEDPTTSTVLTSFFLFCYYGHLEMHNKALHYLQESISFAERINLDDEDHLSQMSFRDGQWRRRIFWLLFVTERAYSLQRQNRVKIQNTNISLPAIFESEDPRLLCGFVNLVNLFLAIDSTFLAAWKGQKSIPCSKVWLIEVQKKLDSSANGISIVSNSSETQQLDIDVSRQWLHVLAWQISVKHGLLSLGADEEPFDLKYPIRLARDLVQTTSVASQSSLDSHGIGMEQKIADIAGCLADVLKCAQGDLSEPFRQGRGYLHVLLQQLSKMRGAQSRYLQPLLLKSDTLFTQLVPPMSIVRADDRFIEAQQYRGGNLEGGNDGHA